MNRPLPKFDNPPVIEVALSVQFDRLGLSVAHMGLAWQRFRDQFPDVQNKPEIEATFEQFGPPERRGPGVRLEVGSIPIPRLWFVNKTGSELVQVQRDRFIRNWRKTEDEPCYPSYNNLRESFVDEWEQFTNFVTEECKTPLVPNQCEVTYVNIIEDIGSGQLANVVSWISGSSSDDYLGNPEETELTLRFILKDEADQPCGRLHITAAPAIRVTDDKRVVRLALTARGAPQAQDTRGVLEFLDKGHEAIVRGFTSITTTEMHNVWERKA